MNQAAISQAALMAWLSAGRTFLKQEDQQRQSAAWAAAFAHAEGEDLPLSDFVAMIEQISRDVGDPLMGWRVGLEYDLKALGEVGLAIIGARTLRGALSRIVDYFGILQDAAEVRLDIAGDDASFSYRILDPDIWPRRQDSLFTLGIFAKIIRAAAGSSLSESELVLEGCCDGLKSEQLKALGLKCSFKGEANLIRFPARLLDRPLGALASECCPNHARLNRQVALRRRRLAAALRVKTLIFQEIQEGEFSQDCVAQRLGMSSRTLRRKLGEEGVSFQKLLDECRMRLAAFEFQTRPETSIAQTALRLGYSEHSTFTRAFVRWWGVPPQKFIREGQPLKAA